MTAARAPGKIVVSGAYAVLSGAPAIVTAVSRYVTADTARPNTFLSDEVRAALRPNERAPWFDASALREGERKLGLGSSAAILVASLFALALEHEPARAQGELRTLVLARAWEAHRLAQGGGSGIDVAASTWGGTLSYRLEPTGPRVCPLELPSSLTLEIWTCPTSASTRELLRAVAELARRSPEQYARWLGAQILASHDAALAVARSQVPAFVAALRAQQRALTGLGSAAGVAIVTPALAEVAPLAEREGAALLPAGAGGGDIAIFVGSAPSSPELRAALERRAHQRLDASVGAPGVSSCSQVA